MEKSISRVRQSPHQGQLCNSRRGDISQHWRREWKGNIETLNCIYFPKPFLSNPVFSWSFLIFPWQCGGNNADDHWSVISKRIISAINRPMIVELDIKEEVELHGVGRKVELSVKEKTESRAMLCHLRLRGVFSHFWQLRENHFVRVLHFW